MFEQVGPYANERGVLFFLCAEASGNGSKTRDLTELDTIEQSALFNVSDETCQNEFVHIFYVVILREKAAAADRSGNTIEKNEKVSGKEEFINNMRDGGDLHIGHEGTVLSSQEVNKPVLAKAGSFKLTAVDGPAHGAAGEAVDEVEQSGELFIDKYRRLDTTLGGVLFFPTEKALNSLTYPPLRSMARRT